MKTSSQHFSVPAVELVPAASASAGWGRLLGSCARAAVVVMLVSGIAYPLATTGIAQISMPQAANGSLVLRNGQIVGSALIGIDRTTITQTAPANTKELMATIPQLGNFGVNAEQSTPDRHRTAGERATVGWVPAVGGWLKRFKP